MKIERHEIKSYTKKVVNDRKIIKMISEESGIPYTTISYDSSLLGDLGIDGDDAWELFERAEREFNLDLSAFHFQKHFRDEPCYKGLLYYIRKMVNRDEHLAAGKSEITVSMFIEACNIGTCENFV